jgi:hypothetical protein
MRYRIAFAAVFSLRLKIVFHVARVSRRSSGLASHSLTHEQMWINL